MDIHGVYCGLIATTADMHCRDMTDECDSGIRRYIVVIPNRRLLQDTVHCVVCMFFVITSLALGHHVLVVIIDLYQYTERRTTI